MRYFALLGCLLVVTLDCLALQKKVYIHYKTHYNLSCYYLFKEAFYKALFEPAYEITVGHASEHLDNYDYIATDEIPKDDNVIKNLSKYSNKLLLFNFEPPLDQVRSQNPKYHAIYSKIFTWNDNFIDNIKYFKLGFPWMKPPQPIKSLPFHQKKLCVFVGHNNHCWESCENYSERRNLISYFENKYPEDFEFYGTGWPSELRTYKGQIEWDSKSPNATENLRKTKILKLKDYKFDFCYENSKNLNGYISERIIDAFLAGCVPIYWGAANITDYVPENCFIDRRKFKDNDQLYTFIKNMDEQTYNTYLENINKYLANNGNYRLTSAYQIQEIRKVLGIQ